MRQWCFLDSSGIVEVMDDLRGPSAVTVYLIWSRPIFSERVLHCDFLLSVQVSVSPT